MFLVSNIKKLLEKGKIETDSNNSFLSYFLEYLDNYKEEYNLELEHKLMLDNKLNNIKALINMTLWYLLEMNTNRYFTYQSMFDEIKKQISLYEEPFDDLLLPEIKNTCFYEFCSRQEGELSVPNDCIAFINNPYSWFVNIDSNHIYMLNSSIIPINDYWNKQVKLLKRPSAKSKRQQYVIEGFEKMKSELTLLNALEDELLSVNEIIDKISKEDWSTLN